MIPRPEHGGRIVFDLVEQTRDRAAVRVTLLVAEATYLGAATVDPQHVQLANFDFEPPAWLLAQATAFLRTAARQHLGEDVDPWPRRIVRWRPSPNP